MEEKNQKMEEKEMNVISMKQLLEAGVHFGHQTKRWNPKMKEYIFTTRDDIHIIDLQKTVEKIEEAYAEILKACENGGKVLFVGTKKQAKDASIEEATRCNSFYVTERWLGGTLTNFKTIKQTGNQRLIFVSGSMLSLLYLTEHLTWLSFEVAFTSGTLIKPASLMSTS